MTRVYKIITICKEEEGAEALERQRKGGQNQRKSKTEKRGAQRSVVPFWGHTEGLRKVGLVQPEGAWRGEMPLAHSSGNIRLIYSSWKSKGSRREIW